MSKKRSNLGLKMKQRGQKKADKSLTIFEVPIFGTQKNEVLRKIWLQRKELLHVATVNPEYIMTAQRFRKFRLILSRCLTVADGYGVVWAAKILYGRQIARISGTALVEDILAHANGHGEKVFLLGAGPGIAERAARAMTRKYPGAKIAWYEGAQSVARERNEEASLTIAKINAYEPAYLLVAYGSPWQDVWIEENRAYLRAKVAIGIGGVLDEWAGVVKPCPPLLDRWGLKWLWRVGHEPWRWRRVWQVWRFGGLVLYHKLID